MRLNRICFKVVLGLQSGRSNQREKEQNYSNFGKLCLQKNKISV